MDKMIAQEVMFVFEGRGIQPGSFTESLIRTMALADLTNFIKLSVSFPEYAEAVRMYKSTEETYDKLVEIAFGKSE